MKTLSVTIFLLLFTCNIFAEEIWSCHKVTKYAGDITEEDYDKIEYYKIDTENAKIFFRKDFKWEPDTFFGEDCIYDSENENIFCRHSWDSEEKYASVYELVKKEIIQLVGDQIFSIRECKKL